LTFGQGYWWVREEMAEPDFGLLVTANRVAEDQLRRVDSRTTSGILRQCTNRVAVPAGIDAFGVDLPWSGSTASTERPLAHLYLRIQVRAVAVTECSSVNYKSNCCG
jgi:hypothetical protein